MPTITIQVDTSSQADLTESREFLDQLIAREHGDGPSRAVGEKGSENSGDVRDPARQAVDDLWNRVGASGRELVITAEGIDGRFAMSDLAAELNVDLSKIVSRFANLGRSLKRTQERVPAAPPFFVEEAKTDAGWTFTMPEPIREAIRQKVSE